MEACYKIIGGDGREYGPATIDELKSWIRDGRIAATTQIWRDDLAAWAPAIQYQELHPEIGNARVPSTAEEVRLAGFWPRALAYLIDYLILGGLSFLILGPVPDIDWSKNVDFNRAFSASFAAVWRRLPYEILLAMLYHVGMNGSIGATLGKLIIGARIVNLDGSRIGYGTALLRFLAMYISSFALCIGYLMVAFRADKRSLHDLIVGTRVIFRR
jgi:uncharacterized RDD family membrane protein YckC